MLNTKKETFCLTRNDPRMAGLSSLPLHELERFGRRASGFGINFAVCNTDGELVLLYGGGEFESDSDLLEKFSLQILNQDDRRDCAESDTEVYRLGEHNQILAAVLKSVAADDKQGQAVGVALIDLGDKDSAQAKGEYLSGMLEFFADKFRIKTETEKQIEMIGTELGQVYEELVLLHKLSTNMRVNESDANYLQMACDSLTEIVSVEGIAILLEKTVEDRKQLVLVAGWGLMDIDDQMAAVLYSRLADEIRNGKEALLDSDVDSPFKYSWSKDIKNIIAVPLCGRDKGGFGERAGDSNTIIGIMVAINKVGKLDFDSTDVKLFNSVANGCAVFIENGRLFDDLKELFIGSLRALTNSIDAKDPYTRGHSERVAFISRWIAEKCAEKGLLEEDQVHKVYLAGLLHDIGKLGIDEAVLCKKGKLTEREIGHIRTHPTIGADILSGIKQMRDIVPGVLCHHERIDGEGYPNGLTGEQIPFIGRIIGLADAFDAMTSERVYRDAMTIEEALKEIVDGLGAQFDEQVGELFLNSDVYQLWDIVQHAFNGSSEKNDFSGYGTIAVGTLIR